MCDRSGSVAVRLVAGLASLVPVSSMMAVMTSAVTGVTHTVDMDTLTVKLMGQPLNHQSPHSKIIALLFAIENLFYISDWLKYEMYHSF